MMAGVSNRRCEIKNAKGWELLAILLEPRHIIYLWIE
jgi:hypothetical protein